jgi:predicted membrane protein
VELLIWCFSRWRTRGQDFEHKAFLVRMWACLISVVRGVFFLVVLLRIDGLYGERLGMFGVLVGRVYIHISRDGRLSHRLADIGGILGRNRMG